MELTATLERSDIRRISVRSPKGRVWLMSRNRPPTFEEIGDTGTLEVQLNEPRADRTDRLRGLLARGASRVAYMERPSGSYVFISLEPDGVKAYVRGGSGGIAYEGASTPENFESKLQDYLARGWELRDILRG